MWRKPGSACTSREPMGWTMSRRGSRARPQQRPSANSGSPVGYPGSPVTGRRGVPRGHRDQVAAGCEPLVVVGHRPSLAASAPLACPSSTVRSEVGYHQPGCFPRPAPACSGDPSTDTWIFERRRFGGSSPFRDPAAGVMPRVASSPSRRSLPVFVPCFCAWSLCGHRPTKPPPHLQTTNPDEGHQRSAALGAERCVMSDVRRRGEGGPPIEPSRPMSAGFCR